MVLVSHPITPLSRFFIRPSHQASGENMTLQGRMNAMRREELLYQILQVLRKIEEGLRE